MNLLECSEAAPLIEKGVQKERISIIDRLLLSLHLNKCKNCTLYKKHSILINTAIQKYFEIHNNGISDYNGKELDKAQLIYNINKYFNI
ncbi:MAG: hypothetical protein HOP11_14120 [Saprospiraceae bacterium]|nr:hypothetical protein [Saprospiraceae bacterium]